MTTTPANPTNPMTLTARCPEDVLAMVPVVLGFLPTESVVMLTFGARETFHARVDLPDTSAPEEVAAVCDALVDPAERNGVMRVLFVVYGEDRRAGARLGRALERRFEQSRIEIVEMLRTSGDRWFPLVGRRPGVPEHGVPYDVAHHRFAAEAVVAGRVTHASRDDLMHTVAERPELSEPVAALLDEEAGDLAQSRPGEGRWVQEFIRGNLGEPNASPSESDLARLLRAIGSAPVRDAALELLERESAPDHVAFWTDVVRRCPDPWVTPAATLLGFSAWQAGHGALAWCAVDRAEAGDPSYPLLGYLGAVLDNAVPPSAWTPTSERSA